MPEYEVMYAPIVLGDDQNFFDQSPYRDVVKKVASETGIETWRVRSQINHASFTYKGKSSLRDWAIWSSHPSQEISRLIMGLDEPFTRRALLSLGAAREVNPEVFLGSFRLLGEGLERYPHWAEYVITQKPSDYSPSGNHSGKKGFLFIETYPSWVMRRVVKTQLQRAKKFFPEYFSASSPYLDFPNVESPRPILMWRIPLEEQAS